VYFLFVTVWLSISVRSIAGKDSSLKCVEWDIKPCILTHYMWLTAALLEWLCFVCEHFQSESFCSGGFK